jgi:hypothetical protein
MDEKSKRPLGMTTNDRTETTYLRLKRRAPFALSLACLGLAGAVLMRISAPTTSLHVFGRSLLFLVPVGAAIFVFWRIVLFIADGNTIKDATITNLLIEIGILILPFGKAP